MTDQIIDIADVVKSPRGRKKVIDQGLLEILAPLKPGQAIRIESLGKIPTDLRGEVSAKLRKHFIEAHGAKPTINYSPEGYPQVGFRG